MDTTQDAFVIGTKGRKLGNIIEQMKAQTGNDYEVTHVRADGLLLQAIGVLAKGTQFEDRAKELCDAWEQVGKWYA